MTTPDLFAFCRDELIRERLRRIARLPRDEQKSMLGARDALAICGKTQDLNNLLETLGSHQRKARAYATRPVRPDFMPRFAKTVEEMESFTDILRTRLLTASASFRLANRNVLPFRPRRAPDTENRPA